MTIKAFIKLALSVTAFTTLVALDIVGLTLTNTVAGMLGSVAVGVHLFLREPEA